MPYIVSGTIAGAPKPVEFRLGEVGRALTQAVLLKSGASDVSIHDVASHRRCSASELLPNRPYTRRPSAVVSFPPAVIAEPLPTSKPGDRPRAALAG